MENADGVGLGIVGAEGIGADEFGQPVGLMRFGLAPGSHFVQHDRHAGRGNLPRSLRPCQAAPDYVDGAGF